MTHLCKPGFTEGVLLYRLVNSREVAQDHYLMVTEDDYERAAEKAVQNPVHSSAVTGRQSPSQEKETAVSPAFARDTAVSIPPRGVEFLQNPREILQSRKTPDQIPDQLGWPPISMRWFDSSANCRTDSARPS
jgi:hypothetical protein